MNIKLDTLSRIWKWLRPRHPLREQSRNARRLRCQPDHMRRVRRPELRLVYRARIVAELIFSRQGGDAELGVPRVTQCGFLRVEVYAH